MRESKKSEKSDLYFFDEAMSYVLTENATPLFLIADGGPTICIYTNRGICLAIEKGHIKKNDLLFFRQQMIDAINGQFDYFESMAE